MRAAIMRGFAERHPYATAAIFAGLAIVSLNAGLRMTGIALALLCLTCLVADPDAPDASAVDLRRGGSSDVGRRRFVFAGALHGDWHDVVRSRAGDCAACVGERLAWPSAAKSTLDQ